MNSEFIVAVHALVFLYHKNKTLSSEVLAENICTNPARVRKVMAKLGKSGLVNTKSGRTDGGYVLRDEPSVTLGEISKALGVNFVELSWRSGDRDMECRIASGMAGYMENLYTDLNKMCQKRLEEITVDEVESALFEI